MLSNRAFLTAVTLVLLVPGGAFAALGLAAAAVVRRHRRSSFVSGAVVDGPGIPEPRDVMEHRVRVRRVGS